jgi:predicted nucleic acid-binding protein
MHYLADSSFWIALLNKSDARHEDAIRLMAQASGLRQASPPLIFTDYIFDEVVTALRFRTGRQQLAEAGGKQLLAAKVARMVSISRPVFDRAWGLFQERDARRWSFTDCTSFVVMRDLGIVRAISFDPDFKDAGFQTLP